MSAKTFIDSKGNKRYAVPEISDDATVRREQADKRHNPLNFGGNTSSLAKLRRHMNIAAGNRPATFNTPLV